jgi:hypothetical protein
MNNTTPVHQLPTSCHVCGTPVPQREGATRPDCWHDFTNAEALAQADAHDRRTTVTYSSGATTAEGHYVDTVIGR